MEPVTANIQLLNLRCYDEGDGPGSAEPYLWVVYFKIDGDTAVVSSALALQGKATVVGTPGNHGNLGTRDVNEGNIVLIPPQIGEFQTVLQLIPTPISGIDVPGQIGLVLVLMEEDNTPDDAVADGHAALNSAVEDALNQLIPTFNFGHQQPSQQDIAQLEEEVSRRVKRAIADNVSIWDFLVGLGDMDDRIGSAVFRFSQSELLDAGPDGIPIFYHFENEGSWDINGRIVATPIVSEDQPGKLYIPQTPSVIAYRHHQANRIYAFLRSQDGRLWIRNWTGANWIWADQGRPAGATVATSPAVVKSIQVAGLVQIELMHAFVGGSDGHLYAHYWNGRDWYWADLGMPANASVAFAPAALADSRPSVGGLSQAFEQLYVFVCGSNGHLFVNLWNGQQWVWADRGTPAGTRVTGEVAVTAFYLGSKRIYAFVRGQDNHLWINFGYLNHWQWADQGMPPAAGVATAPTVVNFFYNNTSRMYAFMGGTDGNLWCHFWDGAQWQWSNQGKPQNASVAFAPCAVRFQYGGTDRIYVFIRGSDGKLWIHYWDGAQWQWTDQGQPGATTVETGADVLKFHFLGTDRMYAFVVGGNKHLYIHYWDGNQWSWSHQGTP